MYADLVPVSLVINLQDEIGRRSLPIDRPIDHHLSVVIYRSSSSICQPCSCIFGIIIHRANQVVICLMINRDRDRDLIDRSLVRNTLLLRLSSERLTKGLSIPPGFEFICFSFFIGEVCVFSCYELKLGIGARAGPVLCESLDDNA